MANTSRSRSIDHCVLPVGALDTARKRLQALGFTVAPDGIHPFGTRNACVYLADDTFLEPLVVEDRAVAESEANQGNVFVARDRQYRSLAGENGFSGLVLTTSDAASDHNAFVQAGLSAGNMLHFSRDYVDAKGQSASVSFQLAFAADPLAPECFVFTCQRIDAPQGGRGALAEHANGATGTAGIIAVADDPEAFRPLLEAATGVSARADEEAGLHFELGAQTISIVTPRNYGVLTGGEPTLRAGLVLAAVIFETASSARTQEVLATAGIARLQAPAGLVVAPGAGQGAHFIFRDPT